MNKKLQGVLTVLLIVILALLGYGIYNIHKNINIKISNKDTNVNAQKILDEEISNLVFFFGEFKAFEDNTIVLKGIKENPSEFSEKEIKVTYTEDFKVDNPDLKEGTILKVKASKNGNELNGINVEVK